MSTSSANTQTTKKLTKRQQLINEKIEPGKQYPIDDAINLLQTLSQVKFNETVDVAVNLGVDPRKSDQVVRGATVLPNGTGKTVKVAVFTQGDNASAAKEAGADIVGFEDLADDIKAGKIDFDVLIATPDAMPVIGKLGQILGPKGLMPNPKVGTVTTDITAAVNNAKAGQVQYRTDKQGIVHCRLGKIDFKVDSIKQNLATLLNDLKKAKPASAKGIFLKKITLSSSMGPGLTVDLSTLGE